MKNYSITNEQDFNHICQTAETGNVHSQLALGREYLNKKKYVKYFVKKDYAKAHYWFKKIMDEGYNNVSGNRLDKSAYIETQYELAKMYEKTEGYIDLAESFKYYEVAAQNLHPLAMDRMALFYIDGEVVGKNIIEALMWYHIRSCTWDALGKCISSTYDHEGERLVYGENMPEDQVGKALDRAKIWAREYCNKFSKLRKI